MNKSASEPDEEVVSSPVEKAGGRIAILCFVAIVNRQQRNVQHAKLGNRMERVRYTQEYSMTVVLPSNVRCV